MPSHLKFCEYVHRTNQRRCIKETNSKTTKTTRGFTTFKQRGNKNWRCCGWVCVCVERGSLLLPCQHSEQGRSTEACFCWQQSFRDRIMCANNVIVHECVDKSFSLQNAQLYTAMQCLLSQQCRSFFFRGFVKGLNWCVCVLCHTLCIPAEYRWGKPVRDRVPAVGWDLRWGHVAPAAGSFMCVGGDPLESKGFRRRGYSIN